MQNINKINWLIKYCRNRLELIAEQESLCFSHNEKYFLKGLEILYREGKHSGDYFAKRYNRILRRLE